MSKEDESAEEQETDIDEGLAAALNDAVDEVTFTEEVEENADDDSTADDGSVDGGSPDGEDEAGGESGSGETGTEDESGESGESEDPEADDDQAGEAGDGSDDDASGDDGDSGDSESGSDEPANEADHLNDPIPEGTNERTATRIQSLIGDVKELSKVRDAFDEFQSAIEASGASPEQYAASLGILNAYNKGTPDQKRAAMGVLDQMRKELAMELGEAQEFVNLSEYPDLVADIEAGAITEERATEIAALRATQKYKTDRQEQATQKQEQATQTEQLVKQGEADLNAFGVRMQADPAYAALYPQLTSILQTTLKRVHPTEWAAVAEETFTQLKAANPNAGKAPAPSSKPKPAANNPLRPKGGTGSNNKEPEVSSALEAMDAALESM